MQAKDSQEASVATWFYSPVSNTYRKLDWTLPCHTRVGLTTLLYVNPNVAGTSSSSSGESDAGVLVVVDGNKPNSAVSRDTATAAFDHYAQLVDSSTKIWYLSGVDINRSISMSDWYAVTPTRDELAPRE